MRDQREHIPLDYGVLYFSFYIYQDILRQEEKQMIFGELKGQSADYQTGHNTGTVRALSYMQQRLRELE